MSGYSTLQCNIFVTDRHNETADVKKNSLCIIYFESVMINIENCGIFTIGL